MSFTSKVNPIVDAVLALIRVPVEWTKDDSCRKPAIYAANTLYGWPTSQVPKPAGMDGGDADELWFFIRVSYCVLTNEEVGQVRTREVADQLDEGSTEIVSQIRDGRVATDLWEWLQVDRIGYEDVVMFDQQAVTIDVSGYRLVDQG